jgi:hypothetical protein
MQRRFAGSNRRLLGGIAVTAALLVPLAVVGAPALARSGAAASQYAGAAQYQYRVAICHLTGSKKHPAHTITVSSAAVAAHMRHGDHLGACTGSETPKRHGHGQTTTSTTSTTTTAAPTAPGKSHGKGHNGK